MATTAAAQRTLDIPELLEDILLHLPVCDLLFARRVCKNWSKQVSESHKIQRTLFFGPTSTATMNYNMVADRWFGMPYLPEPVRSKDGAECRKVTPIINPLLSAVLDGSRKFKVINYDAQRLPWSAAQLDGSGSLGRLLLSHPPAREVIIEHSCADAAIAWTVTGVTVGHIAATLEAHIESCMACLIEGRRALKNVRWELCGSEHLEQRDSACTGWEIWALLGKPK